MASRSCRPLLADNTTAASTSGFDVGERYVDVVQCGSVSILVSRYQPDMRQLEWTTLARPWHADENRADAPMRLFATSAWDHMAHG